ncbi:uncharacterized protein LOC6555693 [Drosophila erecta]|uniref:Glycosyltransferase family 92 protein n=1 Tax=Drosophila erecta TaxID=7220 RepID=B3P9E3_DROER|nr:uncharacterized protein LOC6555693 [Drosophila erecta]EDV45439.1 uncharacterized protein Dere_GG12717 [Drosophila erecta]
MSTRGGFIQLTILVTASLLAIFFLLSALQSTDDRKPTQYGVETGPAGKVTPPAIRHLEEPIKEELVRQLDRELPEVDYGFWYHWAKPLGYMINSTCASYPDPLDLQLHNIHWQTFVNSNVTFRLYAAYLDKRKGLELPTVRILATANQIGNKFPPTHCQMWFENYLEPIVVPVAEFLSVWVKSWAHKPKLNYPHLLSCPIPRELPPPAMMAFPKTVSLVARHCEKASNSLRVNNNQKQSVPVGFSSSHNPKTQNATIKSQNEAPLNFGVCLKGLDFPYVDLSERLIEWFELQRILGASRIYAYMYDVHPAVQRVLDYYQRTGYLELRPLTLANGMPRLRHYQHMLLQQRTLEKRLNELIPYNDCFYRNLYRHDYLVNVDVDEVIMPLGEHRNWHQLVQKAHALETEQGGKCAGRFPALCFINSYFTRVPTEFSNHEEQAVAGELFVLRHTQRIRNYSMPGRATKCFHNARLSLTLHNHFTLKWLPDGCNPRTMNTSMAQMQHYREPDFKYDATDLTDDRSAWKFAGELRAAVEYVWLHLDDVLAQISDLEDQQQQLVEESLDQEGVELDRGQQTLQPFILLPPQPVS